jgi:hypothetical protein
MQSNTNYKTKNGVGLETQGIAPLRALKNMLRYNVGIRQCKFILPMFGVKTIDNRF